MYSVRKRPWKRVARKRFKLLNSGMKMLLAIHLNMFVLFGGYI